jgi:CheY-like chemotaxis protein
MLQGNNLAAPLEPRKVLFIGNESAVSHAVVDFLHTAGYECVVAASKEGLSRLEHEAFDAVLLDATGSHLPHGQTILALKEVRPALAERILLITGRKPADVADLYNLPHISIEKRLSQLWAKLEEVSAIPPTSKLARRACRMRG